MRRTISASRPLAMVFAVAMIALMFSLVFLVRPGQSAAQAQSTSEHSQSAKTGNLVVVRADVKDKTIKFGDELVVQVTLQNQGKEPIRIPPGALLLKNEGWSQLAEADQVRESLRLSARARMPAGNSLFNQASQWISLAPMQRWVPGC